MERRERLALAAIALILVILPATILGYQYWLRPTLAATRVIDIAAAVPEAGGFQPDAIRVHSGQAVTLRFAAQDVTHGIAIGPGLGVDLGQVDPGEVAEITLTFDRAGTYTFYCNTWCSPNHWRMRGVIEVRDPMNPDALPTPQRDPVIEALLAEGVDIDARQSDAWQPYEPAVDLRPSSRRGEAAIRDLFIPSALWNEDWRRTHSPGEALDMLAAVNPSTPMDALADAVVYLWTGNLTATQYAQAATLYNQNCAACHGQTGGGDGPAAGLTAVEPVAFSNPGYLFAMRSDVLYAKIRRGGMGTDMPNFGTLLTPEETWLLVDYLWTFVVGDEPIQPSPEDAGASS